MSPGALTPAALTDQAQLNVPGSPAGATGMPAGCAGIAAPSQHGPGAAAGPHGSHTGPQGAAIGAWQGWACWLHGERNSMKEGRRQLLPPPMQLLQPGAAARAARPSARQTKRDMTNSPAGDRPER